MELFSVPDRRARETAAVLYTVVEGVIHTLAFEPAKLDEQTAIETLVTMIADLIEALRIRE
ncbi:hypothetical protein L21SP2_0364 [Salinispira pacifica]|uniref:Transcriptional regulator, TetR family n=1 Tax=Salinispira pacifica TaxID=1307761 RepID=V5WDV2_9SPIO|nr:hypothetical protein L21SP2_0364 [Salinispira pacifica]